jgi:hypothetical protein
VTHFGNASNDQYGYTQIVYSWVNERKYLQKRKTGIIHKIKSLNKHRNTAHIFGKHGLKLIIL